MQDYNLLLPMAVSACDMAAKSLIQDVDQLQSHGDVDFAVRPRPQEPGF
jgi:hypothetical protein